MLELVEKDPIFHFGGHHLYVVFFDEDDNEITVSLLMGQYAYSHPRTHLATMGGYENLEVGILLNGDLVHPSRLSLEGYEEWWESGSSPVGAYVPVGNAALMLGMLSDACTFIGVFDLRSLADTATRVLDNISLEPTRFDNTLGI
jgi:hypothetical protein